MTILFAQPIEQYPNYLAFKSVPTIISGAADPNFPPGFLLTRDPTQVMRISASGGNGVSWDFGRRRKFDVVSLVGTNLSHQAIWVIYGSNNGSDWTVLHNSAAWPNIEGFPSTENISEDEDLDPRKNSLERVSAFHHFPVEQFWRYIQVQFRDPLNLTTTIGRLFVGRSFKPKQTWQYGSGFSFDDTGTSERTDQGSLASLDGKTIVSANVKMDFISSAEMYDFVYEFNYWRKSTGEILCCLDLENKSRLQKNLFYATIKDGRKVSADQFEAWSQTWIIERI